MVLYGKGSETKTFAASLRYNLEEAGWISGQFNPSSQNEGEGVDVAESGWNDGPCSAAAEALADALNSNCVAALTCLSGQVLPRTVTICVWDKPKTPEMQKRIQSERKAQKERRSGSGPKRSGGPLSPNT